MTLKELYDRIESYPHDTMNFCIEKVFSWRGVYAEPCCSLSTNTTTKQQNLDTLTRLITETYKGWKGGTYEYFFDDPINFEAEESSWSDGYYIKDFITNNQTPEVKHIFG